MDRIVNQMLHIAQYLEWDPTELRPVSVYKHGLTPEQASKMFTVQVLPDLSYQ
jgi:hypothetical protein